MKYKPPPPQRALPAPPTSPVPEETTPPGSAGLRLIAPWWHTLILVAIVLVNSYFSGSKISGAKLNRPALYLSSVAQDLVLLAFIWFGLRLRKVSLRELIGGAWNGINLLIDAALAAGFWIVSVMILASVKLALGLADIKSAKVSADAVKQSIGGMLPQSGRDLAFFLLLCVTAGIFVEILFRGYLQQHLGFLFANPCTRMALAPIFFGASHVYPPAL